MHLVNFSSSDVVIFGKRDIEEALVISQIQINLSPSQIIKYKENKFTATKVTLKLKHAEYDK